MPRKSKATQKATKVQRLGRYGRFKSRKSFRLVYRKAPGGRTFIHYKKRKPGKAHCAECGGLLSGVVRERPYKIRKMGKTKKRPERPFGGQLCSRCMRKKIIEEVRSK